MDWSWEAARSAARAVRAAELGRAAMATVRPRSQAGWVRSRAPLRLLLYVAAQEGLLVGQPERGFALLEPPLTGRWAPPAGYRRRFLRRVDRNWGELVAFGPVVVSLGVAMTLALLPFPTAPLVAELIAVLVGLGWLTAWLAVHLMRNIGWILRLGAPSSNEYQRLAEYLPGVHWSVPLLHQPNPDGIDDLLRAILERLQGLVTQQAQESVKGHARVRVDVTEPLTVLTSGITTKRARVGVASSLRSRPTDSGKDEGVIMLEPPSRVREVPDQRSLGGRFLILWGVGLIVVVLAVAALVSGTEAAACSPACAGHPATYREAVRWGLQRLFLTDPPSLSPLTLRTTVLGWLISLMGLMTIPVGLVATRQEVIKNRETAKRGIDQVEEMALRSRTLVLVAADIERVEVMAAVGARNGREPVMEQGRRRTSWRLGPLGATDVFLAQSGEQGTVMAAGMLVSALRLIEELEPDYVVLTGICFGLWPEEDQQIGDLVVARRMQDVNLKKVTPDRIIPRGEHVGASPLLLDRLKAASVSWAAPDAARVHFGTVLSSNTLVNSRTLVDELRQQFPDAIAGEMEASGVHQATVEEIKPDWIMVKGISDWGFDKSDADQQKAARNAAAFVVHALAGSVLGKI